MLTFLIAPLMSTLIPSAQAHPAVLHARAGKTNALEREIAAQADRYGVPAPLVMVIAYEATRFNPDAESMWGGWGMYDLQEGDQDPSLEHGGALIGADPNRVGADWRLSTQAVAAILAEQGRLSNGGTLPDQQDLMAWWDAARAFSGRQEPRMQDLYARYLFESIAEGYRADTRWGEVIQPAMMLALPEEEIAPPTAMDSSLAAQFIDACTDNYSDYSRGSGDIDMVVIHTVQGGYSSCYNWFANCSAEASAHYVVRSSDGEITQMVREQDVAWHAGHWDTNVRSVGIEHEGWVDEGYDWYTEAMYRESAALTADIAARQGVPLDRSHIIGHVEVPGCSGGSGGGAGCHTDPGIYWDWDYYMGLLNGEAGTTTGTLMGVIADSDIYNGARLANVTVWIAETGDSTVTDASGMYRFYDLPFDTYTVHADAPGYLEGTCGPKTTSASEDWCSIALAPGEDGGGDSDPQDSDPPGDSGSTDSDPADSDPDGRPGEDNVPARITSLPGAAVGMQEVGGCSTGGAQAGLLLAGLAALATVAGGGGAKRQVRG